MPSPTAHTTTSLYSDAAASSFRTFDAGSAGPRASTPSLTAGASRRADSIVQGTSRPGSALGKLVGEMTARRGTQELLDKLGSFRLPSSAGGAGPATVTTLPSSGGRGERWPSSATDVTRAASAAATDSFKESAASLAQRLQQQQQQAARLQALLRPGDTAGSSFSPRRDAPASNSYASTYVPGGTTSPSKAAAARGLTASYGIDTDPRPSRGTFRDRPASSYKTLYGVTDSFSYGAASGQTYRPGSPNRRVGLATEPSYRGPSVRPASGTAGLGSGLAGRYSPNLASTVPPYAPSAPAVATPGPGAYYPHSPPRAAWGGGGGMGSVLGAGAVGLGYTPAGGLGSVRRDAGAPLQQQEEERLRSWVQELRHERRRLEDRLLMGDSQGMRAMDMRDDLEAQVLNLARQRDALASEAGSMQALQQAVQDLGAEADALRQALRTESEKQVAQEAVRVALEAALSDIRNEINGLQQQHARAVDELNRESSTITLKYKRAAQRLAASEEGAERAKLELQVVREEVAAKEAALADLRASSEALQAANAQLQAHLTSSSRDAEGRALELQRALEAQRTECARLTAAAAAAQRSAASAEATAREASARGEFLRSEREKLLKLLAVEQQSATAARQGMEALQGQLRAAEGQRVDLDHSARVHLEALQRQYDTQAGTAHKQHELTMAALEKQYTSLQRQYEAATANHDKLLALHNALRKERDELWAQVEAAKSSAAGLQHERDEALARLAALRAEVKQSMDDVVNDRDQRLQLSALQSEQALREMRERYESQLAQLQQDSDAKLRGALDLAAQLRNELAETHATSEKHRSTVVHLKEQLKEALLNRDDILKELESERDFSRELTRIVNQIRGTEAP